MDESRATGTEAHEIARVTTIESYDEAFWRLVHVAHRRAFRILGVAAEAEDVASETLARASLRWSRLSHPVDAWVSTVASRLAIDHQRKAWRSLPLPVDGDPVLLAGLVWFDDPGRVDVALRLDLARAMADLPRRQRQVLSLAYLSGFTEQEIGALIGCSASSVQTHKQRGLERMRTLLESSHPSIATSEVNR